MWLGAVLGMLPESWWGNRPIGDYVGLLLGSLIFLVIGGTLLTLYTEVIVTEDGLKVRVLVFKWVFIPWAEVLGITVTPLPGANSPSLWRFIQVKRLTIFHRLTSSCYLTGLNPVIIINKNLRGYEELVQVIEKHLEQNQISSREAHSAAD